MLLLEVPVLLVALPFLEEVCYVFVAGVWEAELLVARAPAGYIVLATVMRLINIVLSSLSTLLFSCVTLSQASQVCCGCSSGYSEKGVHSISVGCSFGLLGFRMSSWSVWSYLFTSSLG